MSQEVEIVIVENNGVVELILHNVNFYDDGSLKSGLVSNGAWFLEIDKNGQWWSDIGKISSPEDTGKRVFKRHLYLVDKENQELFGSDFYCEHDIIAKQRGGVECRKCGGWFCF